MSKRKKKRRGPSFSPASMLRPRMDKLWADDALLHKDEAAIEEDLDVLAKNVSPKLFVSTMLRSYRAASEATQSHLQDILPRWLSQSGHLDALKEITASRATGADLQSLAITWLEATGIDRADIKKQPNLFLKAYYQDDADEWREKGQAFVVVTWYTDSRKKRAQGLGFLIDYHPPWDGALKDTLITSRMSPDEIHSQFSYWGLRSIALDIISLERAKTEILTALTCNLEAEIRLSRDTVKAKDMFEKQILSLPDGPDTPAFTMKDFDFLASHGERAEEIMDFEQNVGRRVRLQSGEEVVLIGAPWDDEDVLI